MLRLLLASFLVSAVASCRARQEPVAGPINVLFIMGDQHHYRALGGAGNNEIKTPHLDRLATDHSHRGFACGERRNP